MITLWLAPADLGIYADLVARFRLALALWGSSSGVNTSHGVVPGGGVPSVKVNAAAARKCSSGTARDSRPPADRWRCPW